ncbi:hypothetical protein [Gemmobacter sp.]|uniref:hypothetical protein n=1 Tax=Gemmobacter sp. TaxID=1898957 RepID=UPI002AFE9AD6|nr:hypothetical protein [Gemmobacter sp.]
MKSPFDAANRRRQRDELLHEIATGLWLTGAALGWAILISEGLRLFLGFGGQP